MSSKRSFFIMIGIIAVLFGSYMLMAYIIGDSIPQYDFEYYNSRWEEAQGSYIPALDKGVLSSDEAKSLTEIAFMFYYRCYDNASGIGSIASKDDITELDRIRNEQVLDILYNRMGYTENDMEAAKDDIMGSGYFHSSEAYRYSDRYKERYR